MKTLTALTLSAVLALVSCDTMNGPGPSGDFDPLQTPGAQLASDSTRSPQQRIRPGQFVVAAIDNTAFYNERPSLESEADKLLNRGTSMKVVSTSGSFFRVELDSGEVGFVPSVMVEDPNAMSDDLDVPFEIYPSGFESTPTEPLPEDLPSDVIPGVIEPVMEPLPQPEPEVEVEVEAEVEAVEQLTPDI